MSSKKKEKQPERDLYDMSEGDEEYMPEEDDSYDACLGKREIIGKDVGAEAKRNIRRYGGSVLERHSLKRCRS
jgi:hypothetical protein